MGFLASALGADANFGPTWEVPEQHTYDVGKVGYGHGKNPILLAKYPTLINLHMSDKFRIFVTEKEIVIRTFTIKTPDRWAKRKRNMEHSVKVTIERTDNKIIVSNNFGATWEFFRKDPHGIDHSINGAIADIACAMLTGTITSHLKELSSPKITYTLTIDK